MRPLRFPPIPVLLFLSFVCCGTAFGQCPSAALSTALDVQTCPRGDLPYRVVVVGAGGRIAGCPVTITFTAAATAALCWCAGQPRPAIVAVTDAAGVATFNIRAGGCIGPASPLYPAANITVACPGCPVTLLATIGCRSTDPVDQAGRLPGTPGYAPIQCEVGLADMVYMGSSFKDPSMGVWCADFDENGVFGNLADLTILTPHVKGAHNCVPGP